MAALALKVVYSCFGIHRVTGMHGMENIVHGLARTAPHKRELLLVVNLQRGIYIHAFVSQWKISPSISWRAAKSCYPSNHHSQSGILLTLLPLLLTKENLFAFCSSINASLADLPGIEWLRALQ